MEGELERLARINAGLQLRLEYETQRRQDYDALCARLNAAEARNREWKVDFEALWDKLDQSSAEVERLKGVIEDMRCSCLDDSYDKCVCGIEHAQRELKRSHD